MFSLYLYLCIYVCSYLHRSSRSLIFFKMGVLKNFANLTGKHLCWSEACNLIKKRLQICEILRTSLFTEHFLWLLLFTSPYLHLLAYTFYPHLSILNSWLYCYMNLIKLIKYGEYRNCDEKYF